MKRESACLVACATSYATAWAAHGRKMWVVFDLPDHAYPKRFLLFLHRTLAWSRYIMIVPVIATFLGSLALILYETVVLFMTILSMLQDRSLTPKSVKIFAVGIVEAVDVFLT